jgi:exodeoxyribonuclease I
MTNIAVLDFEAQSASTSTGKIISVSGILYNDQFQELDRFELFCRNVPGYIPDPYSLWVNKGLKKLKESNLSHYQLMLEMHKKINQWSPCIWATWNGHGYDYPLAEKENYRSLLPIYILKTNGNEAADFLPFARAAKLFYPKSLETSYSKSNNPVFKLEDLGMKNFPETDKSKFHTATQDVEITARVMKKIQQTAKPIFESSLMTISKQKAKDEIIKNKLFTTSLYYFGKSRPFACTYFFDHPKYTWPMVYCLETDPKDLMSLDYKSLKETMKKPGKFIRAVPLKHPVILHIDYALKTEPFRTLGLAKLTERADLIKSNPEFVEKCKKAISEIAEEKASKNKSKEEERTVNDPHNQLYSGGFIDKNSLDNDIIKKFHTIEWDKRYEEVMKIKDLRFKYFGERLIYQNEPEALPKEVYNRIHLETAERVLRLEEKNFTTIPMAEHLIDSIRAENDIPKEKLDYINEVDEMIKELRIVYEKALSGTNKKKDIA